MTRPAIIDLDSIVVQADNLLTSELDSETVMMNLAQPLYYGVDATARRIWRLAARPARVGDLCDQLLEQYAVERSTCQQQVCAFLTELHKEGLIRIVA